MIYHLGDDVFLDHLVALRLPRQRAVIHLPMKGAGNKTGIARAGIDAPSAILRNLKMIFRGVRPRLGQFARSQLEQSTSRHIGITLPPEMSGFTGGPVLFEGILALDILHIGGRILIGNGICGDRHLGNDNVATTGGEQMGWFHIQMEKTQISGKSFR